MIRIPTTACRSHAVLAPQAAIAIAVAQRKLHLFLRHAAPPALPTVRPLLRRRRRLLARPYSSPTKSVSIGVGSTAVGATGVGPGDEGARSEGGSPRGSPIEEWPAPPEQIEAARALIAEAAASPSDVLLAPDRDADGLAAGTIVSLTLQLLGKPVDRICTHFVALGHDIFAERDALNQICRDRGVSHVLVFGQGSRASPPLVDVPGTKVLVIDHHPATAFPQDAAVVSAYGCQPVAPSSLLSYVICRPLHDQVVDRASWIALLGVFGNLGSQAPLGPPYPPELQRACVAFRKTHLVNLVGLLNAPRRTPECNTADAWNLLHHAPDTDPPPTPKRIVDGAVNAPLLDRLLDAKQRVKEEVERCRRIRPVFSLDGRAAVIYFESAYQIHPLIASRWASFLTAKNLDFVIVANGGYIDRQVNFSCRVVMAKRVTDRPFGDQGGVDVIAALHDYAAAEPGVAYIAGPDFVDGQRQTATGSLPTDVWTAFAEKCLMLRPYSPDELRAKNALRRSKKRDQEQAQDREQLQAEGREQLQAKDKDKEKLQAEADGVDAKPAAQRRDTLGSSVVRKPEE